MIADILIYALVVACGALVAYPVYIALAEEVDKILHD